MWLTDWISRKHRVQYIEYDKDNNYVFVLFECNLKVYKVEVCVNCKP